MQTLKKCVVFPSVVFALSACDSAGNLSINLDSLNAEITVSGSVGDGPVVGSTIIISTAEGVTLANVTSSANADYLATIPENTSFPVLLRSTGGIDVVTKIAPDFDMQTIMISAQSLTANINPFSTMIVETAARMNGGLTNENIYRATDYVFDNFNFGLDRALIASPISSEITFNNVAEIIKSSEAFGEALRRTHAELLRSDPSMSIGKIIQVLAADIGDGKLNGSDDVSESRIVAMFTISSSKVLLETLANRLFVNGTNATSALDEAIQLTMPTATSLSISDVLINAELLAQTRLAVEAANRLKPSSALQGLLSVLANVSAGVRANDIENLLTAEMESALSVAIDSLESLDEDQINVINAVENVDSGDDDAGADSGTDTNTDDSDEMLVISNTQPSNYIWTSLYLREKLFIDSSFIYKNIPDNFLGLDVLQTANNDATNSSGNFIMFDINKPTTIHVAMDTRATTTPAWLSNGWVKTGLIIDASDTSREIYSKDFTAGKVSLGANEGNSDSAMYVVIIDGPEGGETTSNHSIATPIAAVDRVSINRGESINFNVLSNDSGLDDGPIVLTIIDQPRMGSVQVENNNTLTYVPDDNSIGVFSFVYQIKDRDNDIATASVTVDVLCAECANNVDISLVWEPNSHNEKVDGYKIYYRINAGAENILLSKISVSQREFDALNPSIDFNAGRDMGMMSGDEICMSIKAYHDSEVSAATTEVCGTI